MKQQQLSSPVGRKQESEGAEDPPVPPLSDCPADKQLSPLQKLVYEHGSINTAKDKNGTYLEDTMQGQWEWTCKKYRYLLK